MPLEGALRSKISSLLRPWLRADPDMELKLGLLRCQATWRDLELDPAHLDSLLSDTTRLAVRRVTVGELTLRISPWSCPAVHVSVRGFQAVLAPRDSSEWSSNIAAGGSKEEKSRVGIDAIDPEGALLRGVVENALKTASPGSWLRASLTEALLRHCRLHFQDVSFELQFTEESNACLLRARELTVGTQPLDKCSMSRGVAAVFFMLKKESYSLTFRCSSMEFGLKDNDAVKIVMSSRDPHVCVRLKRLRPMRFDVHFPLIDSGFSPLDIPVIFLVLDLFSGQPELSRDGKALWRIAAQRIEVLSHHPRISFHKLVNLVLLWLSYVHAYESLLSLVGFSDENMFEEFFMRICNDLEFKSLVQHQLWKVDQLERQLPLEAVGRARRIARQRVLLCQHISVSATVGFCTAMKGKVIMLLLFVWNFLLFLFHLVANIMLILSNIFHLYQQIKKNNSSPSGVCFIAPVSQNCVNLSIGELCISLHPISVARTTSKTKVDLGRDVSQLNLSPVFLSMKSFCFRHVVNRIGQSDFLALGGFQVHLSPSSRVPVMDDGLELKSTPFFRVPRAETDSGSQAILWSDPADLPHSLGVSVDSRYSSAGVQAMILENCLKEVWASWKTVGEELEGSSFHHLDHPCFLFDFRNFFINPKINEPVGGALRCNMALGKLNVDLDYSSIVSFAQLLGQTCDSLQWMVNIVKPQIPPRSNSIIEEKKVIKFEEQLVLCVCRMKNVILNVMPENNLQVGAMIAGLAVKLSFHGFSKSSTHNLSSFSLDLENIVLAIWPASRATLLALNPGLELEAPQEYLWLKEPQIPDTPKGQMSEAYVSRGKISHNTYMRFDGLTAFLGNLEDNRRFQIIRHTSMKINASTCRNYLHSFYSTENTCSLSLSMVAGEAAVFLCMDELCILFQVLEGILMSTISVDFDYSVFFSSREYIRKFISVRMDAVNHQMSVGAEYKTFFLHSTQFTIDAHLEFGRIDVILDKSRKKGFTIMKTDNALSSVAYHDQLLLNLPDIGMGICLPHLCIQISCEERHMKVLADLLEPRSILFKSQDEMDIFSNGFMFRDIHHLVTQLYECFLSSFVLHLSAGYDGDFTSSTDGSARPGSSYARRVERGGTFFPVASKVSVVRSHGSHQGFPSTGIPVSGFCFMAELEVGKIIVADCSMQNLLTGQHQPCRLELLTSSGGGFHTINFDSQENT